MNYNYEALDKCGNRIRGVQEADSDRHARLLLRERGITPLQVSIEKTNGINTVRLPLANWVNLTRQMADMTEAGLTLEETLNTVINQTHHEKTRKILTHILSHVMSGQSLSAAIRECGARTPDVYIPLISAGENSGQIQKVLHKLADFLEARQALSQKILLAMIYPMVISVVAIIVVTAMMIWVVPQVISVFTSSHQALPFLTQALIVFSNLLRAYGLYGLAILAGGTYLFYRTLQNPVFKKKWHILLLDLPLVGQLLLDAQAGRLAETLAILVNSGVPLLQSLHYGHDVLTLLPLRDAMTDVTQKIREGASFGKSLQSSGLFPVSMVNMVTSGESSGRLGDMLEQSAKQHQRTLQHSVTLLTSILEPALILTMGGVVLTIVLAIMMPIFNMNAMIK